MMSFSTMKKLWSILLLGILSMLFAEVFSGTATLWFLDAWGLLITYPLYLSHAIFLLNVAFLWKKTSHLANCTSLGCCLDCMRRLSPTSSGLDILLRPVLCPVIFLVLPGVSFSR